MLSYRLRHRVAVQENIPTQDPASGEMLPSWGNVVIDSSTELDAVPAEVLLGPGKEFAGEGATQAQIDARINLRWFAGLTQAMRILWDGRIFNIESIETDLTGREEWRLKCSAGVSEG